MEALEIIQQVAQTVGADSPVTTIANANDGFTRRLVGVTNRAIQMIMRERQWQKMRRLAKFNASVLSPAYNAGSGGLRIKQLMPDFDFVVSANIWQESNIFPLRYLMPEEFLALKISGVGAAFKYFTVANDELLILPPLTDAPLNLQLLFQSVYPIVENRNNSGIRKPYIQFGDDEPVFNGELCVLAAIYKYKQEMGFDYAEEMQDYQDRLESLKNTDAPQITLNAPASDTSALAGLNIPNAVIAGDND